MDVIIRLNLETCRFEFWVANKILFGWLLSFVSLLLLLLLLLLKNFITILLTKGVFVSQFFILHIKEVFSNFVIFFVIDYFYIAIFILLCVITATYFNFYLSLRFLIGLKDWWRFRMISISFLYLSSKYSAFFFSREPRNVPTFLVYLFHWTWSQ